LRPQFVHKPCRTTNALRLGFLVGWLMFGCPSGRTAVVINEVHYNPDIKTEPAEFIELHNNGAGSVDLTGWSIDGSVQYSFPQGTVLAPDRYLVVAQSTTFCQSKFGVAAAGQFTGRLGNDGDQIVLRNSAGANEDEVEYQLGFPWPTVGDPPGYSIELINPALDNSLGGSWRASVAGNPAQQSRALLADHSEWKYLKGTAEASSPTTAWREPSFDDSSWSSGNAPFGYDPAVVMGTAFDDMRGNYVSFFLRRTFAVDDPSVITSLTLEALYDDGFKLWINGTNVLNIALDSGEVPYDAMTTGPARESNSYDTFAINNPARFLRHGTNLIAVQVHNLLLANSSDCFFDARLLAQTGPAGRGPTPGRQNSVYASNAPPQIRQVDHSPQQPGSGQPVRITAKVTDPDGIASVRLHYQLVDPGSYIELTDPEYTNNWTTVPMNDTGADGDEVARDGVFAAALTGDVQVHRRLVRYRITATDSGGRGVTVPYPDDPEPNFAYFVYDGVPAWTGAVKPGGTGALGLAFTVGSSEMNRLPVYHLLARKSSVEDATWFSHYWGDAYPWAGTLVYDGKVYDHIHYRARGGVWRYSMCKNMWKFDFNRGHAFQARDDWGRPYNVQWTKLNLGASIQQGDYNHRGEQGMFESVGLRLFRLAGLQSCNTTFAQFRVIDEAQEADPKKQYEGDFWGVYLAVEQVDGRFLDANDLPDANLYKMEGGSGELSNLGPNGPTDKSDLNRFLAGLNSSSSDQWWRTNWHLPNGYSYQAIIQAIHHYDVGAGKNYFYYCNPQTGLWTVHPWDLDLTWAENMYDAWGYGGEDFKRYALPRPALNLEYRNRVREIRDLLYNSDQAWQLIDEYAGRLRGPVNAPSILDADRAQWDYNPKMIDSQYTENPSSKAGQGRFYKWPNEPTVSKDFNGCVQLMKNYVMFRSTNSAAQAGPLDKQAADPLIPGTPTITFTGPTNHPVNRLTFRTSSFSGPGQFASVQWRVGEITRPALPSWQSDQPWKYEIEPAWESGALTGMSAEITVPADALKVGHVYRARAQMKDTTGRTSHWSAPVEFVAGEPDNAQALQDHLRISELMYQPPAGTGFEFIELHNAGDSLTLDLSGVELTAGIDYTFASGVTLLPAGYLLVVKATNLNNFAGFRAYYGLDTQVQIVGPYSGSLNNAGEEIRLRTAAGGADIFSCRYSDGRGWPLAAAGAGHSLVPLESTMDRQATGALDYGANWRASAFIKGSPGRADPLPNTDVVLNEVAAHTDYLTALDSNDWIELYNRSTTNLALSPNWFLSDDAADLRKWMIPSNTLIPAHGWISFDEVTGFHYPANTGFGLNKNGERVFLSCLPGTPQDRVVDCVAFKAQENGTSLGRYPDGGQFWSALSPTRDAANTPPLPHLLLNELMYRPPPVDGTNDNVADEFIELFNPTSSAVSLCNTNGVWRLNGGVEFDFPTNAALAPGGMLLVVNFDPTNAPALAAFRNTYRLTNLNVSILGPYGGKLGNTSDHVALEQPQHPDLPGEPLGWVIVDEAIYANQAPWPAAADGTGLSLHRSSAANSGNDPANWQAAEPTPGRPDAVVHDSDGDGMPDDWETAYGFDPHDPRDAALDADGDGLTNLQEYLSGTDPRDPQSRLRIESVQLDTDQWRLQFNAVARRSYQIQYAEAIPGGSWQTLTEIPPQSTSHLVTITSTLSDGTRERFFRLRTP